MNEGRRTIIHLLGGQKLEIVVQPRLSVDELLNIAASHVSLKDPDKQYFGIAYVDDQQQYHWLPKERRVLEYDFPRKSLPSNEPLQLYHSVRFFVDSVISLYHPTTVELYFYETQAQLCRFESDEDVSDILKFCSTADCFIQGTLELSDFEYYQAVAYFLQVFDGDFTSEERARSLLRTIKMPKHFVKLYGVSTYTCEDNCISAYKNLVGTPRGNAILKFMQIAETSPTYGSHFYYARDKSGNEWAVAINSRGIYQYAINDLSKPKKAFNWRFLDNLYYRERKFTIEIRDNRRVSRSSMNLTKVFDDELDLEDDLTRATRDPTTHLAIARRGNSSSSVYVHVFFCDSAFACKTLWSTAIAQHQFYLDQRSNFSSKCLIYDILLIFATLCCSQFRSLQFHHFVF
uniref:FERM domain-containing protein n=1 Tax=Syphacia muris TaxID=451379 RepID=A0A0N5B0X4_9BILA